MHAKSLEMLEFPKVREILAGLTNFPVSHELALALMPSTDIAEVTLRLNRAAEARRLLSRDPGFSLHQAADVRESLKMAAHGKVLEPKALLEIQQTLAAARLVRASLKARDEDSPELWKLARGITEQPGLEADIRRCISAGGEVLDSASQELGALRHEVRQKRSSIQVKLERLLKTQRAATALQDAIVTERQGRYVVPVKAEMRSALKGIIHDVSNTGATVFVEPMATIELGNELRQATLAEVREVARVLASLSDSVAACETEMRRNLTLLAEIDLALAKARYAARYRASEPQVVAAGRPESVLRLVQARHPLLKGKAVPLDVSLGADYQGLVITGPNTGGKTVALKCIGLLALMAQSGMPIPAAPESRIPVYDQICADIGDEQSIEQTLSTFSWHLGNIVRILNDTTAESLVLLDELGASTDPAEGAALAQAVLGTFLKRGTSVVATTHYSELKAFTYVTPGLENASLDFNPETLAPTYHLTLGVPGGSNALAIAAGLGLAPEVIADARNRMNRGPQEMETLLAELRREKYEIENDRESLRQARDEAETLVAKRQAELETLRREHQARIRESRDVVVAASAELQREIKQAAAALKKARSQASLTQARQTLEQARLTLNGKDWQPVIDTGDADTPIAAGDSVWLPEIGVSGTVTALDAAHATADIQAGTTHLRLGLDRLEKTGAAPAAALPPVRSELPQKTAAMQLDLRGHRADVVEVEVDHYLDDACLANLSEVRIVHGHGTGVVRRLVRDLLAHHPLVKDFRPGGRGEGGDGATVVKLKDTP